MRLLIEAPYQDPRSERQVVNGQVAGQVALDATADFPVGLAFNPAALDVGEGGRMVAHPADRDDVQGAVELPVAEPLRRWRSVRPEDTASPALAIPR
jgi:hypothetical protein